MDKIEARFIIEIAGFPKEHIEEVMKKVVERIKNEKDVIAYQIFEAKEVNKIWSTFTEIDISFSNIPEILGFCFDQLPSSVEIIKPEKMSLDSGSFTDIINELLAKLHEYDKLAKELKAANSVLQERLNKKG